MLKVIISTFYVNFDLVCHNYDFSCHNFKVFISQLWFTTAWFIFLMWRENGLPFDLGLYHNYDFLCHNFEYNSMILSYVAEMGFHRCSTTQISAFLTFFSPHGHHYLKFSVRDFFHRDKRWSYYRDRGHVWVLWQVKLSEWDTIKDKLSLRWFKPAGVLCSLHLVCVAIYWRNDYSTLRRLKTHTSSSLRNKHASLLTRVIICN